jgi:tyrosyl-tRNA synthetase
MYARVMSISDALVMPYFELCTDLDDDALDEVRHELAMGTNPMRLKKRLARTITTLYHSAGAAAEAEARFEREVQRHETPEEMPECTIAGAEKSVVDLLVEAGLAASRGEARRLVDGGAVQLDGQPVRDRAAVLTLRDGAVLRAGKRAFARLRVNP